MFHWLKILNFAPFFRLLLRRLSSLILMIFSLLLLTSPLSAETQTYRNNFSSNDFDRIMEDLYQGAFPSDLAEILTTYSITSTGSAPDSTAPVISLNGNSQIEISIGESYQDAGATATDNQDGTVAVTTTGTVDTTTVGTYSITYTATDQVGNISTITRLVSVVSGISNASMTGTIKDSINQSNLANVKVKLYQNGIFLSEVFTDITGIYLFDHLSAQSNYSIIITKSGYFTENYNGIDLRENEVKNLETILQIDTQYSGLGGASGNISNALNGTGISGLTINIRKGINTKTGDIIKTIVTEANGYYNLTQIDAGNYTAEISGSGYNTVYITIVILGGINNRIEQNGVINPILNEGELRIVLTWGEFPGDLDSHFTGPILNSSNRFHIYFLNPISVSANLDIDDISSYGPETITTNQKTQGDYRYYVHNYSNFGEINNNNLANSFAKVKVYRGSGLLAEFDVPNQVGTLWSVFEIIDNQIVPINNISDDSVPLARSSSAVNSDRELFNNIPSKNLHYPLRNAIEPNKQEIVISLRDQNGVVISDKTRYDLVSFDITSSLGGTITDNGDLTLKYRWLTPWLTSDQFNYTLYDRTNNINTEASINIVPIVAVDDQVTVQAGSTTTLKILDNDLNLTGQDIIIHAVDQNSVQQGSISQANDTFVYTPKAGFSGTDSFTYKIQTASGYLPNETVLVDNVLREVNKATVRINVQANATTETGGSTGNTALAAKNDEVSTTEGNRIDLNVLNNDQGVSNTTVTFTNPNNGTLIDKGAGNFSYTPKANFVGVDSFSYTITDSNGATSTASVSIKINGADGAATVGGGSMEKVTLWLLLMLYLLHLAREHRVVIFNALGHQKSLR